jgi:hypothetical protein
VWDRLIVRYVCGALMAMTLTSCTLLMGLSDKQCSTSSECVDSQLGDVCVNNICEFTNGCKGTACYENDGGVPSCETDRECSGTSTPKCMKKGCVTNEVFEQWTCPSTDTATSETVSYGFRVVDFVTRDPPMSVVVKACRNTDPYCSQPVDTFTDTGMTGNAMLTLTANFYGFFEVTSAEHIPALLYVTKPVLKNTMNRDVPVLTPSMVKLLAMLAGFPYDATKGLALLEMIDCSGKPAGGVQFKSSRTAPDQFYIIDQTPSKDAELTEYDMTDNTADGGFINLEPGFIRFSAHLGVDGLELGQFNARIAPSTITYIDLSF